MQEHLPFQRAIGKWRSSDGNGMGIGSEHEVEESAGRSVEIGVEIKVGDVVGGMSRREAVKSSSGVGNDGGDSDKRGAGSIRVSR